MLKNIKFKAKWGQNIKLSILKPMMLSTLWVGKYNNANHIIWKVGVDVDRLMIQKGPKLNPQWASKAQLLYVITILHLKYLRPKYGLQSTLFALFYLFTHPECAVIRLRQSKSTNGLKLVDFAVLTPIWASIWIFLQQ